MTNEELQREISSLETQVANALAVYNQAVGALAFARWVKTQLKEDSDG